MKAFAVRDLREHTGELVRNTENGEYSVVSKHGKPLFVAMPFNDALLKAGVSVALADKLVLKAELSVAAGAKLAEFALRALSATSWRAGVQHVGRIRRHRRRAGPFAAASIVRSDATNRPHHVNPGNERLGHSA